MTFGQILATITGITKGFIVFLIFNKQYRAEEKLISELDKKIKKSKTFSVINEEFGEVYKLDNLDIVFYLSEMPAIAVLDKSSAEIIKINCKEKSGDDFQQARANWFHHLLCDVARKRKKQEEEKQKKAKSIHEAARAVEATNNVKQQQQLQQQATLAALDKIRGL